MNIKQLIKNKLKDLVGMIILGCVVLTMSSVLYFLMTTSVWMSTAMHEQRMEEFELEKEIMLLKNIVSKEIVADSHNWGIGDKICKITKHEWNPDSNTFEFVETKEILC